MIDKNKVKEILTEREYEIYKIVLNSPDTMKEIANTLFITEMTLKAHLMNIYGKLGLRNRYDLLIQYGKKENFPCNKEYSR